MSLSVVRTKLLLEQQSLNRSSWVKKCVKYCSRNIIQKHPKFTVISWDLDIHIQNSLKCLLYIVDQTLKTSNSATVMKQFTRNTQWWSACEKTSIGPPPYRKEIDLDFLPSEQKSMYFSALRSVSRKQLKRVLGLVYSLLI